MRPSIGIREKTEQIKSIQRPNSCGLYVSVLTYRKAPKNVLYTNNLIQKFLFN